MENAVSKATTTPLLGAKNILPCANVVGRSPLLFNNVKKNAQFTVCDYITSSGNFKIYVIFYALVTLTPEAETTFLP